MVCNHILFVIMAASRLIQSVKAVRSGNTAKRSGGETRKNDRENHSGLDQRLVYGV